LAMTNLVCHVAPTFAGDTIYAWSEVIEVQELPDRNDAGVLRIRTVAIKDQPCADFPGKDIEGSDVYCIGMQNIVMGCYDWVEAVLPSLNR